MQSARSAAEDLFRWLADLAVGCRCNPQLSPADFALVNFDFPHYKGAGAVRAASGVETQLGG